MPKDRKKKTLSPASYIEESLDSLGVTQLLKELKDVPSVGSQDASYNLEEVLAEFGSGKNSVFFAEARAEREKQEEDFVRKSAVKKEAVKKEASPKENKSKVDTKSFERIGKPTVSEIKVEENKPKLVTNIVKPWEDGTFGDLDLKAKPEPKPWKKRDVSSERQENTVKSESEDKKNTKPLKFGFSSDTLTRIREKAENEFFDNNGHTHGFRINKKEQEVHYELPGEYVKREEKRVRGQKGRSVLLFILCLPLCYLIAATQLGWPMLSFISYANHPFRYTLVLIVAQCVAMLLGYNILAHGIAGIVRLKPKMESVVVFASLASLLHGIYALFNHGISVQQPYCAVVCIAFYFSTYGLYLKNRAYIRACKTAGATKEPTGIFVKNFYGDRNVFKHKIEDRETFVGHLTAGDAADKFWSYFSAIAIIACVVFAAVSSYGKEESGYFVWSLAAISSLAAPFFVMMCYAHPFAIVTKKLSDIGAAIAGWYAAIELNGALKIILRDTDVFPHGCVKLHGLKVFGRHSLEKTLAYTTSIMKESGSGLYKVFAELLKSQFGKTEKVYGLKYHESGGVEAEVNGDKVFLGTAAFMLRMGIRVSENANVKNAIFIAINSEIAGVYNVTYKVNSEVQNGFDAMKRRKIQMVLATLDFNLTPMMIEGMFGLADSKILRKIKKARKKHSRKSREEENQLQDMVFGESDLIYPEIEKRLDLSSDEQTIDRDPCAVVSRGGFAPMAFSVIAARRLKKATIRNIVLSSVSAVIGMLLMFYLTFCGSLAAATPYNVIVYMLLWSIAEYIISRRSGDF